MEIRRRQFSRIVPALGGEEDRLHHLVAVATGASSSSKKRHAACVCGTQAVRDNAKVTLTPVLFGLLMGIGE